MSPSLFSQLVAMTTGLILLTAVIIVWRHQFRSVTMLLTVQGVALAALVATIGVAHRDLELIAIAMLVLVLKAAAMPWALRRAVARTGVRGEDASTHPVGGLLAVAVLTTLAYVVSRPLMALDLGVTSQAVPIGITLFLIGCLVLTTRRRAVSQLVGFVLVDNGISTVAFLSGGGVPVIVELAVSVDVLAVVAILVILTGRMQRTFGHTDLDDLRELHD